MLSVEGPHCAVPAARVVPRELDALTIVEGAVALRWVAASWSGLMPELRRVLPDLEVADGELEGSAMLDRALAVARSRQQLNCPPLLGHLPLAVPAHRGPAAAVRRMYGRMPWTTPRKDAYRAMSVPVGGEGGVRNPNWPPPSRPEDEDIEIRPDQRAGIPYPEWNAWTQSFLTDHVAVLERKHTTHGRPLAPVSADVR